MTVGSSLHIHLEMFSLHNRVSVVVAKVLNLVKWGLQWLVWVQMSVQVSPRHELHGEHSERVRKSAEQLRAEVSQSLLALLARDLASHRYFPGKVLGEARCGSNQLYIHEDPWVYRRE